MVVVTIPFAMDPMKDVGAVEFVRLLKGLFKLRDIEHTLLYGNSIRSIVDVETSEGRKTDYVLEFFSTLASGEHDLHLNIRSYSPEVSVMEDFDIALLYLEEVSNEDTYKALFNSLDEICVPSIERGRYKGHFLSLASETLFDTPAINLYLNEGSVDLYPVLAEAVVDFVESLAYQRMP